MVIFLAFLTAFNPPPVNSSITLSAMRSNLPNLPFDLYLDPELSPLLGNSSCGSVASVYNLEYSNAIYQRVRLSPSVSFFVLSAYYDDRRGERAVRVLAKMEDVRTGQVRGFCQLRFRRGPRHVEAVPFAAVHGIPHRLIEQMDTVF